jgi:hypothetical protein
MADVPLIDRELDGELFNLEVCEAVADATYQIAPRRAGGVALLANLGHGPSANVECVRRELPDEPPCSVLTARTTCRSTRLPEVRCRVCI